MILTRRKVKKWLRNNPHKKFVTSDDIAEDTNLSQRRAGIGLKEVTEEEWGGTRVKFINPFYSNEAHREYYKNLDIEGEDELPSGLEYFTKDNLQE